MSCAQLGLVPDGRRAHLIPFKDSCTLVIGYQGLLELVLRSGEISNVTVQAVCENDEFIWSTGDVTHSIDFRKPRGEAYAYYALATRKDGTRQAEVMTRSEVDRIRSMSQGRDSAAWSKHYDEMAKKTVFRRLAKWLPISSERFNQALDVDVEPDTPETPKFTVVESDPEPEADPGAIPQTTGLQAELTEHGITVETALKFLKVTTLAEAENAPEDKRRALIALNTTKKG